MSKEQLNAMAEHFQCTPEQIQKYIYSVNNTDVLLVIADDDIPYQSDPRAFGLKCRMPSMSLLHDIARGLLFNPHRILEWGVIDPDTIYIDKSAEGYELLIKRALGPYTGGKYSA